MDNWLWGWLTSGISGLQSLANAVATAITTVWDTLTSTFGRWVQAFAYCYNAAWWAGTGAYRLGTATLAALVWVITNKIPHEIAKIADTIRRWVSVLVTGVENTLKALIDGAVRLARALVADLRKLVDAALATIRDTLGKTVTLLAQVAKLVLALLTRPENLATWVAGAIVQAVFRWARAHTDALVRMFLGSVVRATITGASAIERVIADIL
jgi:hypothetical protein